MKRNIFGAVALLFAVCLVMSAINAAPPCDTAGSQIPKNELCRNDPVETCEAVIDPDTLVTRCRTTEVIFEVSKNNFTCGGSPPNPLASMFGTICGSYQVLQNGVLVQAKASCWKLAVCEPFQVLPGALGTSICLPARTFNFDQDLMRAVEPCIVQPVPAIQ